MAEKEKVDILEKDRFFTNADFLVKFQVKQQDGITPQSINGWALSWKLKRRQTDADVDAVLSKTTGSGIAITDAVNGACQVSIADSDTLNLKPGVYLHELKRTDDGFETPLCSGSVILRGSLHKS